MSIKTAKTPRGMASAVHKVISKLQTQMGGSPQYVYLWSPDESEQRGYGKNWSVCWEEGPYEWAYCVSAGEFFGGEEFAIEAGRKGNPTWEAQMLENEHVFCEPYTSYVLCFFNP
jgi:hypothetical protein